MPQVNKRKPAKKVASKPVKKAATQRTEHSALAAGIGATLVKLRTKQSRDQAGLAEAMGCSGSYLSLVETGQRMASLDKLQRAAEVLGLKLSQLIARAEKL